MKTKKNVKKLKNQNKTFICKATEQIQAREWAFACRKSSFDSRRLEAHDVSSKSAAQQVDVVERRGGKSLVSYVF